MDALTVGRMTLLITPGPCNRVLLKACRGKEVKEHPEKFRSLRYQLLFSGAHMEDEGKMMQLAAQELKDARDEMRKCANDIQKLSEHGIPALMEEMKKVREIRMALGVEMKMIGNSLRELRGFFLEVNYEQEIDRIKEFIALCEFMKKLKADGTLDALVDTILRLSVKEETNGRK